MIKSFKSKALKGLWTDSDASKIIPAHVGRINRILDALDAATKSSDLSIPGFDFHRLKGNRAGTFAVSVNGPWRITFRWLDGNAVDVDLEQYH